MYEDDDQALARRAARVSRANLRKPPRHGDAPRSDMSAEPARIASPSCSPKSRPATPCCPRDRAATETSGIAARRFRVPFAGARPRDCHADRRSSSQAHVWLGGDGRVHTESTRPPLSVCWFWSRGHDVVAPRAERPAGGCRARAVRVSGPPYGWWCRQPDVGAYFGRLRALVRQLSSVTGWKGRNPFAPLRAAQHSRPGRAHPDLWRPALPPQASSSIIGCARVGGTGIDRSGAASGCCCGPRDSRHGERGPAPVHRRRGRAPSEHSPGTIRAWRSGGNCGSTGWMSVAGRCMTGTT